MNFYVEVIMKKNRIALALAAVIACGSMTACSPAELIFGATLLAPVAVPSMVGYTNKSRMQSANVEAKMIMTSANTALADMDEEGVKITLNGWYDQNDENISSDAQWQEVYKRMGAYSDAAVNCSFSVYISDGACRGAVVKGERFGIYPSVLTQSNYSEKLGKNPDFDDAKAVAEENINY